MGEAKRGGGNKLRDRVLMAQPFCVLCGGTEPSEEVDHIPPRALFANRHRPPRLEFGACKACNRGARNIEQLAQFVSRFAIEPKSHIEKMEAQKIIKAALKFNPGLEHDLREDNSLNVFQKLLAKDVMPDGVVLKLKGNVISKSMMSFASKMALALHHEVTGRIVPITGFVVPAWYGNASSIEGREMLPIGEHLSEPRTLQQGKWQVSDQFWYASGWTPEGDASIHRAVFQDVFAIEAIVGESASFFSKPATTADYRRPGFLRGLTVPPLTFGLA